MGLVIEPADLAEAQLARFLRDHRDELAPTAPAGSRHALALDGLRQPAARVWVARVGTTIVGSGALVDLEPGHAEVKSMRTDPAWRGRGVAGALLARLVADARSRGVTRLSLETGSSTFFAPAWALYRRAGFVPCPPFAGYRDDPHSVYLSCDLTARPDA